MNLGQFSLGAVLFGFGIGTGLWIGKSPVPQKKPEIIQCPAAISVTDDQPLINRVSEQPEIILTDSAEPQSKWLDLARQALAKNELDQAQIWIERIRENSPYDPDLELIYGEWQYRKGNQAAGLRHLIEIRPLERDANRLTRIDALLDQWLPEFIQNLTTENKLDFLSLLIRNLPDKGNYALQLAELETNLGKYSEAKSTLIPILYDTLWGEAARKLDGLIEERVSWDSGQKIPLEINGQQSIISARVNGNNSGLRLLVDTGASLTVLNRSAAARAGLIPSNTASRIHLQSISGITVASLTRTDLELGELQLRERNRDC